MYRHSHMSGFCGPMTRNDSTAPPPGGTGRQATLCESDFPIAAALNFDRAALAIIVDVEGPSYRPLGAAMAVDASGRSVGSLSSGCIEQDVILRARAAIASGVPVRLRYGRGSPFVDLTLPCGGGLEILIVPNPDRATLRRIAGDLAERRQVTLSITAEGQISMRAAQTGLCLMLLPQLRFLVFGKGPEAQGFAATAAMSGYPVELFSPDPETYNSLPCGQCLTFPRWPDGIAVDPRSAVLLFFHDHDWEPPLLQVALASPAFFVGSQGSLRAHEARCAALAELGLTAAQIDRLAAPFGLIPSARDPRTLAISVLAHVLDRARRA